MNDPISQESLVERVMARGLPEKKAADTAVRDAFSLLGRHLTSDEAVDLGRRVTPGLGRLLGRDRPHASASLEPVQVALRALGEMLDGEILGRLSRVLPADVKLHLFPRECADPAPYASARGTDLATGRPGHSQSIAESESPHAATKISSAQSSRRA